jgi:hypothetical protein
VPSENHHDRVLSGKRRCVALDEGFIDFHAQDRDPVVMKLFIRLQSSELVLDGVGMIWARFFEELLKVVLRRSYLALVVARSLCGMFDAGAARPLVDATINVGCDLLAALLASLLAGLGTLLGTLDSDVG